MSDAFQVARQLHEIAFALGKVAIAIFYAAIIRGVMNK